MRGRIGTRIGQVVCLLATPVNHTEDARQPGIWAGRTRSEPFADRVGISDGTTVAFRWTEPKPNCWRWKRYASYRSRFRVRSRSSGGVARSCRPGSSRSGRPRAPTIPICRALSVRTLPGPIPLALVVPVEILAPAFGRVLPARSTPGQLGTP